MLNIAEKKNVYMFSGKGGVGKTTCAAITALHLASLGNQTLIISTDPTPSLCDIFDIKTTHKPAPVTENLYLEEISLQEVKDRWKRKFGNEVFQVLSAYLPLEPDFIDYFADAPGIGDEFMLDYIRELVEQQRYEMIVWDTAPAGHTLRLLKLPEQFIAHMNAAVKIYSRLKKIEGNRSLFSIIASWKELSQKVTDFLRERTEITVVTIPEALSLRQAERIMAELASSSLAAHQIIINGVVKADESPFLKLRASMQQQYIAQIMDKYGSKLKVSQLPLLSTEAKGLPSLKELEKKLFATQPQAG